MPYSWILKLKTVDTQRDLPNILAGFTCLGFTVSPYVTADGFIYKFTIILNHNQPGAMTLWEIKHGHELVNSRISITSTVVPSAG